MKVIKRNGSKEELDYKKIEEVINLAIAGIDDVSLSDILVHAKIQFYDGITTADIHKTIINSAADLISLQEPNYQYVAARLLYFEMEKTLDTKGALNGIQKNINEKIYTSDLNAYTESEILELYKFAADNKKEFKITYANLKQLRTKYLIKNRELPHTMYMSIAMTLNLHNKNIDNIKSLFLSLMRHEISLASPLLVSCRTPQKQFSSCALLEIADSLKSIGKTVDLILSYVSQKAGFGISVGNIRGLGAKVRRGDVTHTGIIPFIKLISSAVKSCSQGGFRGGSATLFYPYWHYEVLDLVVLKNNRGTEENRVRHMDYAIQLDNFFYEAVRNDEDLYLFSPEDVPKLQEVFYSNCSVQTMKDVIDEYRLFNVRVKTIKARELFSLIIQQRAETGRLYIQNITHCNENTVFTQSDPIKMSNLCMEICLPTQPTEQNIIGKMALCTLGAINLGGLTKDNLSQEIPRLTKELVYSLNNVLNYQNYLCEEAKNSTDEIRALGIGVTNFAYFLAKHKLKYGDEEAQHLTRKLFEYIQYYCILASVEYVIENPHCYINNKKYNYLVKINYIEKNTATTLDWEYLKDKVARYGLANTTLTALMPCESSSLVLNSTNGIEPIRNLQTTKGSKSSTIRMLVPEANELKDYYTYCWDMDNKDYLKLVGIMQIFVDQAISANTYYNSTKYPGGKVKAQDIARDLLLANQLKLKTLYYHNTNDGSEDADEPIQEEDCESCKI